MKNLSKNRSPFQYIIDNYNRFENSRIIFIPCRNLSYKSDFDKGL